MHKENTDSTDTFILSDVKLASNESCRLLDSNPYSTASLAPLPSRSRPDNAPHRSWTRQPPSGRRDRWQMCKSTRSTTIGTAPGITGALSRQDVRHVKISRFYHRNRPRRPTLVGVVCDWGHAYLGDDTTVVVVERRNKTKLREPQYIYIYLHRIFLSSWLFFHHLMKPKSKHDRYEEPSASVTVPGFASAGACTSLDAT